MVKFIKGANRKQAGIVPGPVLLLGALLFTLVVTGGVFAYSYTTATIGIAVTEITADYAEVSANNTPDPAYSLLGKRLGKIDPFTLFNIDHNNDSPDLEVQVYLANPDELSKDYSHWMLRLVLQDINDVPMDMEGITKVLSLHNPQVSFTSDNTGVYTSYVESLGGSYRAFPHTWAEDEEPLIFCKVLQRTRP